MTLPKRSGYVARSRNEEMSCTPVPTKEVKEYLQLRISRSGLLREILELSAQIKTTPMVLSTSTNHTAFSTDRYLLLHNIDRGDPPPNSVQLLSSINEAEVEYQKQLFMLSEQADGYILQVESIEPNSTSYNEHKYSPKSSGEVLVHFEGMKSRLEIAYCKTLLSLVSKWRMQNIHTPPTNKKSESSVNEILTKWFNDHTDDPYPSDLEKAELARLTGLTEVQVNNWFGNKRYRSKRRSSNKNVNNTVTTSVVQITNTSTVPNLHQPVIDFNSLTFDPNTNLNYASQDMAYCNVDNNNNNNNNYHMSPSGSRSFKTVPQPIFQQDAMNQDKVEEDATDDFALGLDPNFFSNYSL